MASNYNPTMQGSGNWCITQISWKVNDSNSAFICEMLSVQSLVLNGEEIWLLKGQWHLFKDKKKNKRMRLFGKCIDCAMALASQCPVCRCGWDLSASWLDGFFLLLYIGSYPWNADASVVGVYHCLPWRLSTQATRSPFQLHILDLTLYHWCCLSQIVSLLDLRVLQIFTAQNPLLVTNLIDWYLKTAYSDYNQEQDKLRNQQSSVEKLFLYPVVSFFNLHIVNEEVSLVFSFQ